jgi:hypothetical protein
VLLGKIADFLNPIAKDISQIKTELLHVKTAVDALKAGQHDVREGQKVIREELAKKCGESRYAPSRAETRQEQHIPPSPRSMT